MICKCSGSHSMAEAVVYPDGGVIVIAPCCGTCSTYHTAPTYATDGRSVQCWLGLFGQHQRIRAGQTYQMHSFLYTRTTSTPKKNHFSELFQWKVSSGNYLRFEESTSLLKPLLRGNFCGQVWKKKIVASFCGQVGSPFPAPTHSQSFPPFTPGFRHHHFVFIKGCVVHLN